MKRTVALAGARFVFGPPELRPAAHICAIACGLAVNVSSESIGDESRSVTVALP